jgi:DUF4097 and DUF4098 domain-containing protein YvlB
MTNEFQNVNIKHTEEHEESELTLPAGKPMNLTASNSNGEIRVFSSDRPNVAVRTTKHGAGSAQAIADSYTNIVQTGNTIVVSVENVHWVKIGDLGSSIVDLVKGKRSLSGLGVTGIDIEIELPRETATHTQNKSRFNSASGDIHVSGLSGKIDVNTASGEITVEEGASVVLTANTASGEVTVLDVGGRFIARSASGDINVQRGRLEHLTVNTASGDVNVEASWAGKESSSLHTVSGDVNLRLASPAARLTFSTVSGDADVHAPFERDGRGQWRLGPAGQTGPTISVKTVSGDIHVDGSIGEAPVVDLPSSAPTEPVQFVPPAPPAPPTPPAPPSTSESFPFNGGAIQPTEPIDQVVEEPDPESEAERLNVLQALERGEIDIDEAMSQLDAIEGQPAE